ncbi:MAG: hypothetical protein JWM10_2876 [Myxococcaceae bacterium]|nr:hypothetical protein [Myxococcaceae bacterium]
MKNLIGWASSVVLVLTIFSQVRKQWRSKQTGGVSHWLYAGQIVASLGFTVYSAMVHDRVFVITNSVLLVSAVVGLVIYLRQRSERPSGH